MKANVFITDAMQGETVAGKLAMLTFFGALDDRDGEKVFHKIDSFCKKNPHIKGYIFDFGEVENLNSKSIGSLITLNDRIQKQGGKIVIARPLAIIQRFLSEVGVDRKINSCPDLDTAKTVLKEALDDD